MTHEEISETGIDHEATSIYEPEVIVLPTQEEVDQLVCNYFLSQVAKNPQSVLTLPTGTTPIGMYERVIQAYKEQGLDFSGITIFNLDEYWPLSSTSPDSYASFMDAYFLSQVNIPSEQIHIPNSEADDPHEEAMRYELLMSDYPPIDLAIVGIGPGTTCHIGFNEKGSSRTSRTRYMPLDEQTFEANRSLFANPEDMPVGAITQGIGNILEAQAIVLIAKGKHKAWGIQRALEGEVSSEAPASFLRLHPNVTFILDEAAAGLLQGRGNMLFTNALNEH